MIVLREGKWLCRVFSTQRFSWRNVRIFRRENWLWLTISCVIFILIMETLWIHCHVRKLFRKNTLCNQYTINKRRPVVQRPSRFSRKVKIQGPRPDDHLNVALISVISTIRRFYWEELELLKISRGAKIFWKVNSSRTLSRRPVGLSGGRADWKATFRGLRPDAHLHVARISVISTIRRF